jgi:phage antirepressor YoqD-like protein
MAIQTEGRRLALRASLRPQFTLWLVGWLVNNAVCISGNVSQDKIIIFKLIDMNVINCSRIVIKNSYRKLYCHVKTKGSQQGVQYFHIVIIEVIYL